MNELKKIIPREGIIVPLPDGNGNLPEKGRDFVLNSYWYQRKADGDVTFEDVPVVAEAPAEAPAEAEKTAKTAKTKGQ